MTNINTYVRIKPSNQKSTYLSHDECNIIARLQSNKFEARHSVGYEFRYDHVFGSEATQTQIFQHVAQKTVMKFIEGFNGTIFAYGQTSSGKTHTIEGDGHNYDERGIASRAISLIFDELSNSTKTIEVHVSYIEIYQDVAYDLLNPASHWNDMRMQRHRVSVLESGSHCYFHNLTLIPVASESLAQTLYFNASAMRHQSSTPSNQRSSRSHAVFTIYLSSSATDGKTRSKLHLVDLAGSERVSKYGVNGIQLNEAKSINKSLHHLEQVILSLQKPVQRNLSVKKFVPYRNSQLTMVLKDSLGGNCNTSLIATICLEDVNVGESISTCRFAQRVSRVVNKVRKNVVIDDQKLIEKLKAQIIKLKLRIKLLESNNCRCLEGNNLIDVPNDERDLRQALALYFLGHKAIDINKSDMYTKFVQYFEEIMRHSTQEGVVENDVIIEEVEDPTVTNTCPNESQLFKNNVKEDSSTVDNDSEIMQNHENRSKTALRLKNCPSNSRRLAYVTNQHRPKHADEAFPVRRETCFIKVPQSSTNNEENYPLPTSENYLAPYDKQMVSKIHSLAKEVKKKRYKNFDNHRKVREEKMKLKAEEMSILKSGVNLKIQTTSEQLADQHAFIIQLKHRNANEDVIQEEILAEFQLRKKLYRLNQKLDIIDHNIKELQKFQQNFSESNLKSFNNNSIKTRGPGGRRSSKTAYDILRVEEQKEEEIEDKLKMDTMQNQLSSMAIKEEQTRQRLANLKRQLAEDESGNKAITENKTWKILQDLKKKKTSESLQAESPMLDDVTDTVMDNLKIITAEDSEDEQVDQPEVIPSNVVALTDKEREEKFKNLTIRQQELLEKIKLLSVS